MQRKKVFPVGCKKACPVSLVEIPAVGKALSGLKRYRADLPSELQGVIERGSLAA
jgi:hypothetical protein